MTILTIARTTFGEAIRRKVLITFLGVAIAVIPISLMFGIFTEPMRSGVSAADPLRQELTTIKSFCFGMVGIAGLLISLIMGIQLVPAEIERRTIYTILAKPVNRYEFLLGKFMGAVLTLLVSIALMGVVVILAVALKTYGEPFGQGDYAKGITEVVKGLIPTFQQLAPGVILIFFQLMMVAGTAVFFSTFLGTWVNFFATSALYCVGSLSQVTASLLRGDNPAITRMFAWIIHYLVPQFGNFHVLNPILNPQFKAKHLDTYIAQNSIYALLVCVMLMAFGIWIFEKKEV